MVFCCGPKCSMCCLLLSVWGIIMLVLLGIFFRIKTPALVEDIPIDEAKLAEKLTVEDKIQYIDSLYDQASINCFIAAGMYVVTLALSAFMWKFNQRSNYTMS